MSRTVTQPPYRPRTIRSYLSRRNPARLIAATVLLFLGTGTALLMTPWATSGEHGAGWVTALFTATSAGCLTGLTVVDTSAHWSVFGQVVIIALVQIGGFGIMSLASLLGLLVSRRMGLATRLHAAAETKSVRIGDVKGVLLRIVRYTVVIEGTIALVVTLRYAFGYGEPWWRSLWHGVFQSLSAFNNAGFSLHSSHLIEFSSDPWILIPVTAGVILGGIGFPVLAELHRHPLRVRDWSQHTQITVLGTLVLLAAGWLFMCVSEWTNPRTLGPMSLPDKLLNGWLTGVSPRSSGINSLDTSALRPGTWVGSDVLMFIGGGSAGTAGGIKVGTFFLLLMVIIAEARGDQDVSLFRRRVPTDTQRQALAVALLGVFAVVAPTLFFSMTTPFSLDQILVEVISAAATVGLSTGITGQLSSLHQVLLVLLMFAGRVGPVTVATALALRHRDLRYRHPVGYTLVG